MKNLLIFKFVFVFTILSLIIISCDDTTNPSSSYIIEKNVIASSEEQIFESGNDFKIVFPPNAINQNLELKVKKESSAPTLTIPNMKLGKNIFKLSFEGFQSFTKTVKVYLNFDASKIEKGKTPEEAVKGLIFVNGKWKEADFEIDKVNNKIIFNLNNLNSKNSKDEPVFLANDEIILGDGYTTTDVGQSDNPLNRYGYFSAFVIFNIYYDNSNYDEDTQWNLNYPAGVNNVTWNGNNFSVLYENIEPKDWITDYEALPDSTIETIYGTVTSDGSKIIEMKYEYYSVKRVYYGEDKLPDLKIIKNSFNVNNLKIYVPNKNEENMYPFVMITGEDAAKYVTQLKSEIYNWGYDYAYDKVHESLVKSTSFNFKGAYSRLGISFHKI